MLGLLIRRMALDWTLSRRCWTGLCQHFSSLMLMISVIFDFGIFSHIEEIYNSPFFSACDSTCTGAS